MKKLTTTFIFNFFLIVNTYSQTLDSLKLSSKETPSEYTVSNTDNYAISIQARTFYKNPAMYGALIGKFKSKDIQNFESKNDKGSIMYFEFEDGFNGEGFLEGLLWGGDKPTKEHPEKYYTKGNFLIIWSFHKGSSVEKLSEDKIKMILK